MEKTIPIANFPYHSDAALLIGMLEAEEIKCFLKNEHLVNANPLLSTAVGGIDVSVRESDYDRAMAIVKEMEANKKASLKHESVFEGYTKVTVFCPSCDSSNCFRKKKSFFSFGPTEHVCGDCLHAWKE